MDIPFQPFAYVRRLARIKKCLIIFYGEELETLSMLWYGVKNFERWSKLDLENIDDIVLGQ